jgi:hypothetical protein
MASRPERSGGGTRRPSRTPTISSTGCEDGSPPVSAHRLRSSGTYRASMTDVFALMVESATGLTG